MERAVIDDTPLIQAPIIRDNDTRNVIELRKKENGLLKINDIFGPPVDVKNEVFREFLNVCADKGVPDEDFYEWMDKWMDKQMVKRNYTRIRNNVSFSRDLDKTWAKEYKMVNTR